MFNKNESFFSHHVAITPSSSPLSQEMAIFTLTTGDVVVEDDSGQQLTYAGYPAFQFIPVVCSKVLAATTASVIGCW